jgi:hypothetical protein
MDNRAGAIGGVILTVGATIGVAAYTVGSPTWDKVCHRPAFWVGVLVALIGVVMGIAGYALPDGEVTEGHRTTLQGTVRTMEQAVANFTRIQYGDPATGPERRKAAFEIHFRRSQHLLRALREWDREVHDLAKAEADLNLHLHIRKDELGIHVPAYDETAIIETFQNWTVGRARRGELSDAIDIGWVGYGDNLFPGPGSSDAWITVPRVDGESNDDWRQRATDLRMPVDQLLAEVQTWGEGRRIGSLWKSIRRLQKPTAETIQPALLRERFRIERQCPICRENRK